MDLNQLKTLPPFGGEVQWADAQLIREESGIGERAV